MRPLTDQTPKPLLKIGSNSLIEHHILRLHNAGYHDIVINTAWLGGQIRELLGTGERYGVSIRYSDEGDTALETGGGIYKALPLLGKSYFLVVNGDIWCEHSLAQPAFRQGMLAHLVLVDNPAHNPAGDFSLIGGLVSNQPKTLTFSGIGWYHPDLFADCKTGKFPLAPILRAATDRQQVSGERYLGHWSDIGTPERLEKLYMTMDI